MSLILSTQTIKNVNDIPQDCFFLIFQFITSFDKLTCRSVCRLWNNYLKNRISWKHSVYKIKTKTSLTLKYYDAWYNSYESPFSLLNLMIHIPHIQHLEIDTYSSEVLFHSHLRILFKNLTQLVSLSLFNPWSYTNINLIIKILHYLPSKVINLALDLNIKEKSKEILYNTIIKYASHLQTLRLPNISFKLENIDDQNLHGNNITLMLNKLSRLRFISVTDRVNILELVTFSYPYILEVAETIQHDPPLYIAIEQPLNKIVHYAHFDDIYKRVISSIHSLNEQGRLYSIRFNYIIDFINQMQSSELPEERLQKNYSLLKLFFLNITELYIDYNCIQYNIDSGIVCNYSVLKQSELNFLDILDKLINENSNLRYIYHMDTGKFKRFVQEKIENLEETRFLEECVILDPKPNFNHYRRLDQILATIQKNKDSKK